MAYHDSSGQITIDEVVAQGDIVRMQSARTILEESLIAVNRLIQQAEQGQGEASVAVAEKATELAGLVSTLITELGENADLVRRVVEKYRLIDEELARMIYQKGGA